MEIIVVDEQKNRTFNFVLNWGVVALIVLFSLTILILFIYGLINFARGRVDQNRLEQLTRENNFVQKEIEKMEYEIKALNILIDSLAIKDTVLNQFSGLMPLYKYMNNRLVKDLKEDTLEAYRISGNLDELLSRVEKNYANNKEIVNYLKKKENLINCIPSIAPVNGWFMRGFGYAFDPFVGTMRMHEGIDIAAPVGTPVIASADGVVEKIQFKKDFGLVVEIRHSEGFETIYAHCQNPTVKQGQSIKRGDTIAYVGSSGKTTGPHLHYEIRINGIPIDPLDYILSEYSVKNE
ncbi:MAG: M23 family metallopeptidase [candidate division WOR-3 bacterium]